MVVFLLAPLAAYGATWAVHTAAAAFIGREVISGRMAKREAKNAFRKDLNPLRDDGKQECITFELTEDVFPPELKRFARRYVMFEREQKEFDAALTALANGEETSYDFDWMLRVQECRLADRRLVQN